VTVAGYAGRPLIHESQGLPSPRPAAPVTSPVVELEAGAASATSPPSEGVDVLLPGRLPAHSHRRPVSRSPSTPMAGVAYPGGDWPPMPGSAWRCNAAGVTCCLGPQRWADRGRRRPPAAKTSLEAQRPGPRSSPHLHYATGGSICLGAEPLLQQAQAPAAFPFDAPPGPRRPAGLQLLMAYLLNPSERWWRAWPTKFCPGPSSPARPVLRHRSSSTAIEAASSSGPMWTDGTISAGQAMGQRLPIASRP